MGNASAQTIDGIPLQKLPPLHEQFFSEEALCGFIEEYIVKFNLSETAKALPLMKKYHKGQTRKGSKHVPYIQHPLTMACHALTLGVYDDDIIAAMLLHDVCEDCGVTPAELPVNENVKTLVDYLTFSILDGETDEDAHKRYYRRISGSRSAALIKVIDRCNNISTMASAFSPEHMICYIKETEKYVLPLFDLLSKSSDRTYKEAALLIKYHLCSVMENTKGLLALYTS